MAVVFLAILATACGGDKDGKVNAILTDPATVPTTTPLPGDTEPIFLEEGAITPISGSGGAGQPGVCADTYIVESGDSFFSIAQKCGVDLADLRAANPGIEATNLQVGQKLQLPPQE